MQAEIKAIKAEFSSFKLNVNHLIEETINSFKIKMEILVTEKMNVMEEKIRSLEMDMALMKVQHEKDIEALKNENKEMKDQYSSLMHRVKLNEVKGNDNEQYSRRNNLRIRGLVVNPQESIPNAVIRTINSKLSLGSDTQGNRINLSQRDIEVAHYIKRIRAIARPPATASANFKINVPSIIVRFFNREMRDRVIRARKQLKDQSLSISEDLTTSNQQLLLKIKQLPSVAKCWSWNGKLFYQQRNQQTVKQIKLHDEFPA